MADTSSGPRSLRWAAVLGAIAWTAVDAAGWGTEALMEVLAHKRFGRARFVEEKFVAALTKPVMSSGELHFVAPNRLEKHTLKPVDERLVLDGETLILEREGKRSVLALDELPEVAALVGSIHSVLLGDREALERSYRLSVNGDAESWQLLLVPSLPALAQWVAYVRIHGSGARVRQVEIVQAGGDRSVLSIEENGEP